MFSATYLQLNRSKGRMSSEEEKNIVISGVVARKLQGGPMLNLAPLRV